ncbi:putative membrane protein [Methylobacillus rhizosphaerae]|uniref:Putative membrane protein n=1 Tax=Methylobacillus rhizosphaerae TaxID=551994 RepID=A0A238ZT53_9PROT|nr:phage holin family protein [Methylobacillus rhizosphaerae]SNR86399.1 putative membrane protein [Methylobacillus rhizosphaerae]
MINNGIIDFIIHWGIMSLSLWIASLLFSGIHFSSRLSLLASALVLGFVNAVLRPLLLVLTLPLTLVTLGFFALVINALMIMLVARLIKGFELSGFWTAFFASIFIAILGFLIEWMLPSQGVAYMPIVNHSNTISI